MACLARTTSMSAARAVFFILVALATAGCERARNEPADEGPKAAHPAELAAALDKQCVGGDLESCRRLGVMYQEGTGISPDPRRATALFGQACKGNNLSACNNLAMNLSEGIGAERNAAKAAEVYQRACDANYALACRNLGLMYRDGRGVPADATKAEPLLVRACDSNVPFACKNAGDLDASLVSRFGPHRWKRAIRHYTRGCDFGDPTSCRQIGILYLEGKGVPKSSNAAAVWLERGCLPDDAVACRLLGNLVTQGVGTVRDVERGRELFRRACNANDDEACRLLESGVGSPGEPPEGGRAP